MISLHVLYLQLLYEVEKPFLLCSWYVYATGVLTLAVILPGLNNLLKQNNVFEYYIFQEKIEMGIVLIIMFYNSYFYIFH